MQASHPLRNCFSHTSCLHSLEWGQRVNSLQGIRVLSHGKQILQATAPWIVSTLFPVTRHISLGEYSPSLLAFAPY